MTLDSSTGWRFFGECVETRCDGRMIRTISSNLRGTMYSAIFLLVVLMLPSSCALNSAADQFSGGSDDCTSKNYTHKSEAELGSMTLEQQFDELVKEQTFHKVAPWQEGHDNKYLEMLDKLLRQHSRELLPMYVKRLETYDPGKPPVCNDRAGVQFALASAMASDIDNSVVRLRGIEEGRKVIVAMERAVERMRNAGFDAPNHELHSRYSLTSHHLEMAKGTNIHDEITTYTLKSRYKVEMTSTERLGFSNFLTSLDPRYPTWSETDGVHYPSQLKDADRYLSAYREFKAKK